MSDLKNVHLEVAQFALMEVEKVIKKIKEEAKKEETKNGKIPDNTPDMEKKIQKNIENNKGKYKTLVKKMDVLIQKNGLIGTFVFNLSKINKEKAHKYVLEQAKKWCIESAKLDSLKEKLMTDGKPTSEVEFIENITKLNPRDYRFLTKEYMILFAWMKRFADGMIEGEDEGE